VAVNEVDLTDSHSPPNPEEKKKSPSREKLRREIRAQVKVAAAHVIDLNWNRGENIMQHAVHL
jgi:hypothetical protein